MKSTYQTKTKKNIREYLQAISPVGASVKQISNEIGVSFSTAYRALGKMEDDGTIIKILSDTDHQAIYCLSLENHCDRDHLHLKCSSCGKIIHLECPEVQKVLEHVSKKHGFSIRYEDSILFGLCEDCQKKKHK